MENTGAQRAAKNTKYGITREVPMPFDTAVERTREVLKNEGFGILSEIRMDEKFKGLVERLAFHEGGWLLAAGGDNGGFVTAYAADGKTLVQENAPSHVNDVAWDAGFAALYAACHDKISVWELT